MVGSELREINAVDAAESQAIQQIASGIWEERPWVWLRRSLINRQWRYVPQISLEGALELFRRLRTNMNIRLELVETKVITTSKGTPLMSVIIAVKTESGETAYGGQDAFMAESEEENELRLHGTAQALHKAIRNAIINFILTYLPNGPQLIRDFVNEALENGRAAIIERREIRMLQPVEKPAEPEETTTPTTETKQEKAELSQEINIPPEVVAQLEEIDPKLWRQYLLAYTEVIQRDPISFTPELWQDFVKWIKTPISRREVDELVKLSSDLYQKERGQAPEDRREVFRYLFEKMQNLDFIPKGTRITELTLPQFTLLKSYLYQQLYRQIEVTPEDIVDDFPF